MHPQGLLYALSEGIWPASGEAFNTPNGWALGWGTTVGNGKEGWAPSALFIHTDGSAGSRIYKNDGTVTSASFTDIADAGIADAGSLIVATTVEGALQEIFQHALTSQGILQLPLTNWKLATNFDVPAEAASGGTLCSNTVPILSAINDATDGCQRLAWAASDNTQIIQQIVLPYDFDSSSNMQLITRIASAGTTDAVGFTVDTFFSEGDTKVTDTSATNQTTSYANKATTIAAADIPAANVPMTIGLTPVAHTTDIMYMTGSWIKYQKALLTS